MATLLLTAAGNALGTAVSGSLLGVSTATVGAAVGGMLGARIDAGIFNPQKSQTIEGFRMDDPSVTSATEGVAITRLYGTARIPGNIIWATELEEVEDITTVRGPRRYGVFGRRSSQTTIEYNYFTSFAIALCEGEIGGVLRIWADGELLDASNADAIRVYNGTEDQLPDPLIQQVQGDDVPAYRGIAYVVFERLALTDYGNRIPNFTFEVVKPSKDIDAAEQRINGVCLLPGSGEYAIDVVEHTAGDDSATGFLMVGDYRNATKETEASFYPLSLQSLDRLRVTAPNCGTLLLVISWFGDDLRAGHCTIRPKVENSEGESWVVNGISREQAQTVSTAGEGLAYGGTYTDSSVVGFIQAAKERGYNIVIYPFIMMDIPNDNTLPNPYSDDAAEVGQPVYPWRGRITCSPAAGFSGTVDKTVTAGTQVESFFGNATPADFTVADDAVSWNGGIDFGLRRMILHYAHLCAVAGGVDAFLIGTEMRGLTQIRSGASTYPAVQAFRDLAADVRSILGAGTKISYAADWSEYFGHHPDDGSNDVFFHLDPLWADANIDFIGIDNYMPLSDWRDGFDHADVEWGAIYNKDYLFANMLGGEGYDWFYASAADRAAQMRTPITDGAGKPWVFRYKDIPSWWSNQHYNRPGGGESATPTAWVPQSKPVWFTEYGCPAIDKGTNQPNVFVDPKSSESFVPYFSNGFRDDTIQRAYIEVFLSFWSNVANNPLSSVYGDRMIDLGNSCAWAWDLRAYPVFPAEDRVWSDAENYHLGHWLNGRIGGYSAQLAILEECEYASYNREDVLVYDVYGSFIGYTINQSIAVRDVLNDLGQVLLFSGFEHNGSLVFRTEYYTQRKTSLSYEDFVESAGDGEDVVVRNRDDRMQLPDSLRWRLLWDFNEYEGVVIQADKNSNELRNMSTDSFNITHTDGEYLYAHCAATLINMWAARETISFSLPMHYIDLTPADYVEVTDDNKTIGYVVNSRTLSDRISVECRAVSVKTSDVKERIQRLSTSSFLRDTGTVGGVTLLNIPALSKDTVFPFFYVAYTGAGTGVSYIVSDESGNNFSEPSVADALPTRSASLLTDLPASLPSVISTDSYFDVSTTSTINNVSLSSFLRGDSAFLVRHDIPDSGDPVRYEHEVILFKNAELLTVDGFLRTYRITNFVRGYRGGDHLANNPVIAESSYPLLLLGSSLFMDSTVEDLAGIGEVATYTLYPRDSGPDSPRAAHESNLLLGTPVKPFSPVHLEHNGDYTFVWVRRSRSFSADDWGASEPPLVETDEGYRVLVINSADVVVREVVVVSATFVYNSSDRMTDFGTSTPTNFKVAVAQIGDFLDSDYTELTIGD